MYKCNMQYPLKHERGKTRFFNVLIHIMYITYVLSVDSQHIVAIILNKIFHQYFHQLDNYYISEKQLQFFCYSER